MPDTSKIFDKYLPSAESKAYWGKTGAMQIEFKIAERQTNPSCGLGRASQWVRQEQLTGLAEWPLLSNLEQLVRVKGVTIDHYLRTTDVNRAKLTLE